MSMFEKASRMKLRFKSDVGTLSVEDLWDLALAQLNKLAKSLNKELKSIEEEDFLQVKSKEDTIAKLRFDLVLYILNVKKGEADERKNARAKKAEKDRLLEILAKKKDYALENLTEEELLKKLEEL